MLWILISYLQGVLSCGWSVKTGFSDSTVHCDSAAATLNLEEYICQKK